MTFTYSHDDDYPGVTDAVLRLLWTVRLGRAAGWEYVHTPVRCERSCGIDLDELFGLGQLPGCATAAGPAVDLHGVVAGCGSCGGSDVLVDAIRRAHPGGADALRLIWRSDMWAHADRLHRTFGPVDGSPLDLPALYDQAEQRRAAARSTAARPTPAGTVRVVVHHRLGDTACVQVDDRWFDTALSPPREVASPTAACRPQYPPGVLRGRLAELAAAGGGADVTLFTDGYRRTLRHLWADRQLLGIGLAGVRRTARALRASADALARVPGVAAVSGEAVPKVFAAVRALRRADVIVHAQSGFSRTLPTLIRPPGSAFLSWPLDRLLAEGAAPLLAAIARRPAAAGEGGR